MLPATVPVFWIWIEPTSCAACFSASKDVGQRMADDIGPAGARADHTWVVVSAIPRSSESPLMSSTFSLSGLAPSAG